MRKLVVAMLAAALLSGCLTTIEGAFDEHARAECEREARPRELGECLDRIDQNRRDRQ